MNETAFNFINITKYLVFKRFSLQIMYMFTFILLISQVLTIGNYYKLILVVAYILVFLVSKVVKSFAAKYKKIYFYLLILFSILLIFTTIINIHQIANYFNYLVKNFNTKKLDVKAWLPIIIVLMYIFSSIYVNFRDKFYFCLSPIGNLILFIFVWYTIPEDKYSMLLIVFIFTFFIDLFVYHYDHNKRLGIKSKLFFDVNLQHIMKYGISIIIIMLIFVHGAASVLGTKSIDEIKRDALYSKIKSVNGKMFDSIKGKLGGKVELTNKVLFKVKGEPTEYLRGSVKNYYNGDAWSNSIGINYKNLNSSINRSKTYKSIMGETSSKALKVNTMEVIPVAANWKTLFAPNNVYSISMRNSNIVYDNYNCFTNLAKGNNNEYEIKYYASNSNLEIIDSTMKDILNYDVNSSEIRDKYSDYLQLPINISDRTVKLVEEITKNCKTNTEKVIAIRNYLRDNYSYSTDMKDVPAGKEFVDYFLFEEKSGYCTYFATACSVMLRIAGIPTRYVEGYHIDDNKFKDGYYSVLESNGHAFAEVLVSPKCDLWSIVESTPGVSNKKEDYQTPEYARMGNRNANLNNSSIVNSQSSSKNHLSYISLVYILIIILLILTGGFLFFRIKVLRIKNKIIKMDSTIPLYNYLRNRLKSIGYFKLESVPDSTQLEEIFEEDLKNNFNTLLEVYYKEYYGGEKENIDKAIIYSFMEKHLRKKQGFFKYWFLLIRC